MNAERLRRLRALERLYPGTIFPTAGMPVPPSGRSLQNPLRAASGHAHLTS